MFPPGYGRWKAWGGPGTLSGVASVTAEFERGFRL